MNRNQTPARLRHTVALAVGLGCSSAAISIGLGPIHVNSSIGQPMSATIPVEGLTTASAKGATVQLASAAAYRARGIELLPSHQKLRFSLVPSGKGYVIRVTSTASIREPFVNFLITINSNGSTVTREYAAFFNPDPLNPNAAEPMAVVEKPTLADSDSKSKKKGKKDKAEKAERELLPVGEPESRAELAGTRRSEPVLANPKKEKEQKEKAKKDKAKEQQIAARKAQAPLRAASADSEGWGGHDLALQQKQTRPAPAARNDNGEGGYSYYSASVKPGSIPVGSKYGPVKSNETLFSIANAARPSDSVSIQQMMRAIYNANRGSFAHNDMGNLMIGSTLVIPDPSAAALPAGKAVPAEVADNSAKAKAEAKKAEKAAKAAAKAAAAAAAAEVAQNAEAKADETAQKEADNKAAAAPVVELAQNDSPAPEAASGGAENAPLDGNALTLDGADSLAANQAKPAATEAPVELAADNAPQIAANDTPAEQPAEVVAVQPEPIPNEQPAEGNAPVAVEVAANDAAPESAAPATVPEMKPAAVVAVAQEKPEDKVSSGLPLPLLAAAGTGVLALGGAAAFMLAKRKRRDDEDNMEEFSQDAIDRLAAEMDANESQKVGDKVGEVKVRNAAPASADLDGLDRLNAQLSELDDLNNKFSGLPKYRDEYDDGEPHSADELPDDFFKDLEIPDDEPASPVAAVAGVDLHKEEPAAIAVPAADDSADEDYDFFDDLEKFAAEDDAPAKPAAAALANGNASHDAFDDFLSLEKDSAPAEKTEPKLAAVAHADEAEAADEFDDFLSFASEETPAAAVAKPEAHSAPEAEADEFDDFLSFASEETPAAKVEAQPAAHADKTAAEPEDEFDFLSFAAETPAAPAEPVKAEPAPATADEGDDFDFISFAEEAPAKAEPAPAPAPAAEDDGLDFFASDEDEKPAPHHTVVSDAVVIAAEPVDVKAEDEALDFFALEDEPVHAPEAVAPVAAAAADDETLDFFNSDTAQDVVVEAAETVKTAAAPQHIDQLAAAEPAPKATVTISKPVIAPAASDADVDVEAMEINLDMATSFIVMGKAEKARSWLDEVLESGSEAQKIRARSMLEQLEKV
ncbi:Tfp pilus assembly protein FimV [Cardiobacterium hominis]|uniref:FimV domain protein n=1 Tax=Cardiobacterium hominis (strain ATCC 15826 / DSM 8339 / NCTC 10426 / 6573) TaxID=638300 RepID=C8NBU8_CARH6|nr:FimV/HubP family polar landmark protein [Cardiobacterium hominis]EEV87936.1 FimV domain protein [Cardiobacterium hominis ATCC 15826]VEG77710.1 Tfp pilus assembly protein FimV [Cardiobacterium hominis]